MAATATATFIDATALKRVTVYGTIVLSGNYGTGSSHGDTLNLATLAVGGQGIVTNQLPLKVTIYETPAAGTSASGFDYNFSPGTTQANGQLQVFGTAVTGSATTPSPEYTEGAAYVAGLTGAVISFEAIFARL